MHDRPSVAELLESVRRFLEDEVVPALEGPKQFHARVAANVLAIAGRELAGQEDALVAEWRRLNALLGWPAAAPPERLVAVGAAVRELTEDLCARIRRGDADAEPWRTAVREAVTASVREKLAVANPRMLS